MSISKFWLIVFTFQASTFLISCSDNSRFITEGEFDEEWPFTVNNGRIECLGDDYVIVFISDGARYALNEAARATEKYKDIEEIVKYDENYPGKQIRMDVSVIEFEALKLCDHD